MNDFVESGIPMSFLFYCCSRQLIFYWEIKALWICSYRQSSLGITRSLESREADLEKSLKCLWIWIVSITFEGRQSKVNLPNNASGKSSSSCVKNQQIKQMKAFFFCRSVFIYSRQAFNTNHTLSSARWCSIITCEMSGNDDDVCGLASLSPAFCRVIHLEIIRKHICYVSSTSESMKTVVDLTAAKNPRILLAFPIDFSSSSDSFLSLPIVDFFLWLFYCIIQSTTTTMRKKKAFDFILFSAHFPSCKAFRMNFSDCWHCYRWACLWNANMQIMNNWIVRLDGGRDEEGKDDNLINFFSCIVEAFPVHLSLDFSRMKFSPPSNSSLV